MMTTEEIISRLKQGDPLGLAKAITMVENRRKDYKKILKAVYPLQVSAFKLGITGAPGSGKSTLAERILFHLRRRDAKVGVLAVDPSSPISGGALLGDRIRMIQHSSDPGVYIRSMASRGYLGGLSAAAYEAIDLMTAAGKEVILIETVGVGQSEIDVVAIADLVLTVLTPFSGDEIQVFKAGIIEITDIFVINKSDLGGAETKIREIQGYFINAERPPVVIPVSAKNDEGIDGLLDAAYALRGERQQELARKREMLSRNLILKIVQEKLREEVLSRTDLGRLLDQSATANIYIAAEQIYRQITQGGKNDPQD